MMVRKNVLPRTINDAVSMSFVMAIVPLIYWFELWIVLPELYETNSGMYVLHFALGNLCMVNIVGNYTYAVLCDTSTRRITVSSSEARANNDWRFCSPCEALAPPRSWHCDSCGLCILKRDHHCVFTGCCVGHSNHRYFLMFVLHLFVATLYSLYFNTHFIWPRLGQFSFPLGLLKVLFPLCILVTGLDGSVEQLYLTLYIVCVVGMLFTGALGMYHLNLISNGLTAGEKPQFRRLYDLGWRRNFMQVLGERWYLVWLLPYIESRLPSNGISWHTSDKLQ